MKRNLQEEIRRIKNLNNQISGLNESINEAEKLTLGQKLKLNPVSFVMKFKDDFINYFNNIADLVNRPDFCQNVESVSQMAINSLKTLINTISKESEISDAQVIDYVMSQLNSGLAQAAIKMAQEHIPSDNVVPKEILDSVVNYLKSQYPEEGPGLVSAINDIITKLNQPVQSFCQGSTTGQTQDGVVTEGIDYRGVYADVSDGNIIFIKGGNRYVYELEADIPGPNVSITVNNLFKENGKLKMSYSHIGGGGTNDLGESNLNYIISQIPKDEISFTNNEGKTLILNKVS